MLACKSNKYRSVTCTYSIGACTSTSQPATAITSGNAADLDELVLERSIGYASSQPDADNSTCEVTSHLLHHTGNAGKGNVTMPVTQQLRCLQDHHAQQTDCDVTLQGWLLPLTEMFSKRRQFACDSLGRIHLIVGKTLATLMGNDVCLCLSKSRGTK